MPILVSVGQLDESDSKVDIDGARVYVLDPDPIWRQCPGSEGPVKPGSEGPIGKAWFRAIHVTRESPRRYLLEFRTGPDQSGRDVYLEIPRDQAILYILQSPTLLPVDDLIASPDSEGMRNIRNRLDELYIKADLHLAVRGEPRCKGNLPGRSWRGREIEVRGAARRLHNVLRVWFDWYPDEIKPTGPGLRPDLSRSPCGWLYGATTGLELLCAEYPQLMERWGWWVLEKGHWRIQLKFGHERTLVDRADLDAPKGFLDLLSEPEVFDWERRLKEFLSEGEVDKPRAAVAIDSYNPILPDRRTRELSLKEAATHLGIKGKKASEKLGRRVREGTILAHKVHRQAYIFDIDEFTTGARGKIRPAS